MFTVTKRMEVAGAHCLNLPYDSKCRNLHGHNWRIEVEVQSSCLNDEGMVIDFTKIKEVVGQLDHAYLNDIPGIGQPTAEHIAQWIAGKIDALPDMGYARVSKVTVQESEGNIACYIP